MDAVERAVPAPQIKIIVQRRAWRQVFRDRAPLAACAEDVYQTVGNLAHISPFACYHRASPVGGGARLGGVAVFLAEIFRYTFGKAARAVEAGVHQLQPARPAESAFTADFVGKSENECTLE